jgi:macrodomain Ter protein organizer (MatP/YcbG family)
MGRPPRTDHPRRATFVLPGVTWTKLSAHAAREKRTLSDVVTAALALYLKRMSRRKS